jgi:hypothetical protein
LEKRFLDRYDAKELLKECHLQADLLAEDAMAMLKA